MKLIKIKEDHYVVVDDSEIKEGDWVLMDNKWVVQVYDFEDGYWGIKNDPGSVHNSNIKKITHSTQPLETYFYEIGDRGIKVFGKIQQLSLQEVKKLIGEKSWKGYIDGTEWEVEIVDGKLKIK